MSTSKLVTMESLPTGLVSTSSKVSAELGNIDAVDIRDVVLLWKAYSTRPSAHDGDTGHRLQNLFWRIWSSERLSTSLTGSALARLFLQISEPRSLAPAKEYAPPLPSLKRQKHPSGQSSSGSTGRPPLQPILKKSNSSSHGETQKTARLLLTDVGGQSVTRKPSNPPTPVPPSRPVTFGEPSTRPSQKKTFVVASKAKGSKRRPVLIRRKSSQQSSVCSTRAPSPEPAQPPPATMDPTPARQEKKLYYEPPEFLPRDELLHKTYKVPSSNPDPSYYLFPDEQTELPPEFLSDLKEILHRDTPLGPLRPRSEKPVVGFFSMMACRSFDVRHLSEENYAKPSPYKLVDKDFRARFAEQKRLAEEYYQYQMAMAASASASASLGASGSASATGAAPGSAPPNTGPGDSFGTEPATTTTATATATATTVETAATTVSTPRSVLGDDPQSQSQSQGAATAATTTAPSSVATSIGNNSQGLLGTEAFSLVDHPPVGAAGVGGTPVFLQMSSAFSVPRGPGGLNLMIEERRRQRELDPDSDDDEDEVNIFLSRTQGRKQNRDEAQKQNEVEDEDVNEMHEMNNVNQGNQEYLGYQENQDKDQDKNEES
ncbi:GATA-like domain-containing protein [Aspergillus lucknowensis]|uniref:Nitrogen regulatory protein areA GATA-like domain-containing protein n=1 Tax=Aspergillus lucknowensis TaxID=176173 RepID=A0ABR4LVL0_9EURO